jgi:hypothetical protein
VIIEGFDIENWSCIRKASVANLPETGVVVLHAPNQTGKSSIVKALRACLMDYPSNSAAAPIKGSFPRGTDLKPTVTVAFRKHGVRYQVTKNFGTNKSELRRLAGSGDWETEAASAADVHRLVVELSGGQKSDGGLHELLWPPQGQFDLPKKFDDGVAGKLRGILGVLQTPLDDSFLQKVKERWNVWHSGERKPGKEASLKKSCSLHENRERLKMLEAELAAMEAKFREVEGFLRRIGELESRRIDLAGQLERQRAERKKLADEFETVKGRIAAFRLASERYNNAEKDHRAALKEQDDRRRMADRLAEVERELPASIEKAEHTTKQAALAATEVERLQKDRSESVERRRQTRERAGRISAQLNVLSMQDRLLSAKKEAGRAAAIEAKVKELEQRLADRPAPDQAALDKLRANRRDAERIRAERDAASIRLRLQPEPGATPASVVIDGKPAASAADHSVQRSAEANIPGWGTIVVHRGSDLGGIDDIESRLKTCDAEFTDLAARFGISANEPDALERLAVRKVENEQTQLELSAKRKELKEVAPKGTAALQSAVVEIETKLKDSAAEAQNVEPLPNDRGELESLAATLERQIKNDETAASQLESQTKSAEDSLKRRRKEESDAKDLLLALQTDVKSKRETLAERPSEEELVERVRASEQGLEDAQRQLNETKLSDEETAFESRLAVVEEAVTALEREIQANDNTYHKIEGQLSESEGLHGRRAAAAAKVERLRQLIEDEELERAAVDRLYELFDDCRDKQLGAVLEPIHARVLHWMKTLGLGDYTEVKFSDGFLPEKLVRAGGGDFALHEESTGAQEQFAMLVRLALGSILSTADDPAVAILDDPLTHSDVGRLAKMRGILRRAAEGDPNSNPPAGPLQIIVLTCHPEWFRDERATVIDLQNPDVFTKAF